MDRPRRAVAAEGKPKESEAAALGHFIEGVTEGDGREHSSFVAVHTPWLHLGWEQAGLAARYILGPLLSGLRCGAFEDQRFSPAQMAGVVASWSCRHGWVCGAAHCWRAGKPLGARQYNTATPRPRRAHG